MSCKLLGGLVLGGLLAAGAFGWNAMSYVRTSIDGVKGAVRQAVPLEFEIRRARTMLNDLIPEVRKNMLAIAQEEAGLDQLASEIAESEQRRDKDAGEIVRLKNDLATGKKTFQYAGKSYSADAVRSDLTRRFDRHRAADESLADLRKMYAAREQSVAAAREKMAGMLSVKKQLEVEIEQLDARHKMIDAAQTTSELCLDDGRLSRTKQLIADLKSRLDVSEKLLSVETKHFDEIPLDAPAQEDIVDRVSEYFGDDEPAAPGKVEVARSK